MIQRGEGSEIYLKMEGAMIQRGRGIRNISQNGRAMIQSGEGSEIYLKMEGAMIQRGEESEIYLKMKGR